MRNNPFVQHRHSDIEIIGKSHKVDHHRNRMQVDHNRKRDPQNR